MKNKVPFLLLILIIVSCKAKYSDPNSGYILVNQNSTIQTKALFKNLFNNDGKILFGQQDATAYGIGWEGDENRSDIKSVTGSFPAVYGWDLRDIDEPGTKALLNRRRKLLIEGYERGGLQCFSWHYDNPVTGKSFYDTTRAVANILPGGSHHLIYEKELDKIAWYLKNLVDKNNKLIPVIFRPFHELDGSWFWWGARHCTPNEIKSLYRFTVKYLRDVKDVKNVLYAFSPDRNFNSESEYLERYPGDEYVDIVGVDNYWDLAYQSDRLPEAIKKMQIVSAYAKKKNKIAALTETGQVRIPDANWWTEKLLKVLKADSVNVSFTLVWRNANTNHFFAPYPGQKSCEDFINFKNDSSIVFNDTIKDLYK